MSHQLWLDQFQDYFSHANLTSVSAYVNQVKRLDRLDLYFQRFPNQLSARQDLFILREYIEQLLDYQRPIDVALLSSGDIHSYVLGDSILGIRINLICLPELKANGLGDRMISDAMIRADAIIFIVKREAAPNPYFYLYFNHIDSSNCLDNRSISRSQAPFLVRKAIEGQGLGYGTYFPSGLRKDLQYISFCQIWDKTLNSSIQSEDNDVLIAQDAISNNTELVMGELKSLASILELGIQHRSMDSRVQTATQLLNQIFEHLQSRLYTETALYRQVGRA